MLSSMSPHVHHTPAHIGLLARVGRLCSLLALVALTWSARGQLVLSNFSAAKPIKIMPIGDSITDDCAVSGAWRSHLQSLLDTNGYAFTNVGRQLSSASTGFTRLRHEGYCGSVIAAPGVYGPAHNYASADNYLLKIVPEALAITNNQPDLVLVLIGANDLGRGRNPYVVATNDMPNLLDIIFSNAPSANVLLAKPTMLLNATAGYGTFATNVPIYNTALQTMVNQRRGLGQKVFLADMYSAVDYATMFGSDHLHPNPLGLQAIAKEWFARIKAISIGSTQSTSVLVNGGAVWKYFDNGQDLGTNWAQSSFDDSGWNSGPARLGYGDPAVATMIGYGPEPTNKYPTAYFRHAFVVPEGVAITNLSLRLARAGGAVVWLNGQEAFRTNLASGPITYTNLAKSVYPAHMTSTYYPTTLAVPPLPAGTNLLAVEVHQFSPSYSSFGFDLELIGSGYVIPPPTLSIAHEGESLQLNWSLLSGAGHSLYSTTNLTATEAWTLATAVVQTNNGRIVVTQAPDTSARYYRLQKP